MLLFDLVETKIAPESHAKSWIPLLCLLVLGLFFSLWTLYASCPPVEFPIHGKRTLSLEERERVFFELDRLRDAQPKLRSSIRGIISRFVNDDTRSFVEAHTASEILVRLDREGLIFSPQFFEADGFAQQGALQQIVVESYPEVAVDAPSVATNRDQSTISKSVR